MDELRVVRREEGSLILANDLGEEYRLVVDESVAVELRSLARRSSPTPGVRPREIQALLRAGKTRDEVAAQTGLDPADVERYEEPVRAEQRYMLELARAVGVRTDPSSGGDGQHDEQRFGEVITGRLVGLGNKTSAWRAWRDETAGWFIGLTFDSRDGDEHDAIWSFDHRKRVLSPVNPDATSLSKVGEVGDRLIPKLRAVDNDHRDRFDSDAFDPDALLAGTDEQQRIAPEGEQGSTAGGTDDVSHGSTSLADADAEYERRREIEQRAVKTPSDDGADLSQTADLLDALRRRRGERAQIGNEAEESARNEHPSNLLRTGQIPTLWGGDDAGEPDEASDERDDAQPQGTGGMPRLRAVEPLEGDERDAREAPQEAKPAKKGRAPIPSWDDILFGTRSDDDPA